ncbi:20485_t:CDS:2, partial [Racocetra persica]
IRVLYIKLILQQVKNLRITSGLKPGHKLCIPALLPLRPKRALLMCGRKSIKGNKPDVQ